MTISTAVDVSAVARVVGIKTEYKDLRGGSILYLPQRLAIVGQGRSSVTYATTKRQITSATEAGNIYGFGSPIHLAAMQLFPANGDGIGSIPVTVYPLVDAETGVAAVGSIGLSGVQAAAAEYVVSIAGIKTRPVAFTAAQALADRVTALAAAINAVVEMPVTAAAVTTLGSEAVTITAKWDGVSGDDIIVSVSGDASAGSVFAITQPTGGLVNPIVDAALAHMGNVWETAILNCLNIADTTALDTYRVFGESRWGALVRKPLVVFTGVTEAAVADATEVSDARKTDRVNAQLVAPGSVTLPCVVAAGELTRILTVANNNPPVDYSMQPVTGVEPGADSVQWLYTDQDAAVKKGSSTIEVIDNVVRLSDTITMYHPTGDPLPAYRHVNDIVKIQNILFNLDLIFATAEWASAPLVPDGQPVDNPAAKTPALAKAEICELIDSLGRRAVISDPKTAKSRVKCAISSTNPRRLDVEITLQISGNCGIISIDFNFGFFFGGN